MKTVTCASANSIVDDLLIPFSLYCSIFIFYSQGLISFTLLGYLFFLGFHEMVSGTQQKYFILGT